MKLFKTLKWLSVAGLLLVGVCHLGSARAADRLFFDSDREGAKHIVLVSGDEEYRTEESMPMLAKILNRKHGFKCTVLFALAADGTGYIDANNQQGIVGWEALGNADLMIIGTRFRTPDEANAKYITDFLNAGKPVIGIRTSTHAFRGKGAFGSITYDDFGIKVLGERWVSHHGGHKRQGARSVVEEGQAEHPVLNGVGDIFCPSDVYGVRHLTESDQVLLRAAVTETLDPDSPNLTGDADPKSLNDPMQAFAWLHSYETPDEKGAGKSFCTTGGASVDFVDEDMRRLIVNAALFLTDQDVPAKADVAYVDPFYPSFYGFIRDKDFFKTLNLKPEDLDYGKTPASPDPQGSPDWKFRPSKRSISAAGGSNNK
ncbi:MAG: ThuA domain-containing protein [Planctomycetota bacterium]